MVLSGLHEMRSGCEKISAVEGELQVFQDYGFG